MTELMEFLKGFNVQNLIAMAAMLWGLHHSIAVKLERHESRIDRLYEIFIELRKDSDQKFYELLKEKRKND